MVDGSQDMVEMPGKGFSESRIDADGFSIRYREAGKGDPLIWLHGGGGLRISPVYDMLAETRRVIAFEIPGFGDSAVNDRSESMAGLAETMLAAVSALGIDNFDLVGSSFGGKLAAWMAAHGLAEGHVSWEQYVSDPRETPPEALITDMYFLLDDAQ